MFELLEVVCVVVNGDEDGVAELVAGGLKEYRLMRHVPPQTSLLSPSHCVVHPLEAGVPV